MNKSIAALIVGASLLQPGPVSAERASGPLEDYVRRRDPSYRWVKRREGSVMGCRFVELTLTSQTWHDIVWRHQLFVVMPPKLRNASQAILMIGAGRWNADLARPAAATADVPRELTMLAMAAIEVGSPAALVMQVPQQPIFGGKMEDQIISYTFEKYLRTQDATWPLLLPMVKSTVRAMDAVTDFAHTAWKIDIKRFTLTGASKRGWTTWLTAAVDPRVAALAPMVIDVLNMLPQMRHQVATWGTYSEQIHDYTERGIQQQMQSSAGHALRSIVDPYAYREQIQQPKLILLGTNDRYWPLDALNIYWDGLEGDKYVLYVPNNGHSLRDPQRVIGTIAAFHRSAVGELKLPKLSWDHIASKDHVRLELGSDQKPYNVSAWVATAPTRDFRDAHWTQHTAVREGDGYAFRTPLPERGYTAIFGEAAFQTDGRPYYLSTTINIARRQRAAAAAKY